MARKRMGHRLWWWNRQGGCSTNTVGMNVSNMPAPRESRYSGASQYPGVGVAAAEPLVISGIKVGNAVGPGTAKPGLKPLKRDASTRETSKDFHGCAGSGGWI